MALPPEPELLVVESSARELGSVAQGRLELVGPRGRPGPEWDADAG